MQWKSRTLPIWKTVKIMLWLAIKLGYCEYFRQCRLCRTCIYWKGHFQNKLSHSYWSMTCKWKSWNAFWHRSTIARPLFFFFFSRVWCWLELSHSEHHPGPMVLRKKCWQGRGHAWFLPPLSIHCGCILLSSEAWCQPEALLLPGGLLSQTQLLPCHGQNSCPLPHA